MIDDLEKTIIALIQGDLPAGLQPFAVLAERLGIGEDDLLAKLKSLVQRGIIRRFGATLRHKEAGFISNAMVAWLVPEDRVEETGKAVAAFQEVSHCYQRKPQKGWAYNLYTMIHGYSKEQCVQIAGRMSREAGIDQYIVLFTEKEFKKTSMEYF
jgi:siroheme decarboxylase